MKEWIQRQKSPVETCQIADNMIAGEIKALVKQLQNVERKTIVENPPEDSLHLAFLNVQSINHKVVFIVSKLVGLEFL